MSQPGADRTHLWLSLFSASMTLGIGIFLPFFPVWLASRGLSETGLAMVIAAPALARMAVNPPIAAFADRHGAVAQVLAFCAAGGVIGFLLLGRAEGFWAILAGIVLVAIMQGPILSLADALIFARLRARSLQASQPSLDYGSIRAWGSAAVFVGMVAGGQVLGGVEPQAIIHILTGAAVITALGAMAMARATPRQRPDIVVPTGAEGPRNPAALIAIIIAAAALVQASHAMVYTFSTLDWQAQGLSTGFIGLAWAAGVFAEVLFFLFARHLFGAKGSALKCLLLGATTATLRWSLMVLVPSPLALIALQLTHGLTFGATHLGAVSLLSQLVAPAHRAQAQAWHSAAISFALFVTTAACGPLHLHLGAGGYSAMAMVAVAGLGLALLAGARLKPARAPG